jgi:hypothetical protein
MNPNNIPSGMPTSRPVSFNQSDMGGAGAGQMTPEVMSRIVDSAFQTGVMAQVDFDQLLATQPPQNKQALMRRISVKPTSRSKPMHRRWLTAEWASSRWRLTLCKGRSRSLLICVAQRRSHRLLVCVARRL